jgi:phosphotransferase system enzyme I (PtsP)
MLPVMAPRIDFVSVGTNDLTQYILAVDRNNAQVSDLYEVVHPSMLMAMKHIRESCSAANLPVSVCGELAGDPIGVLLLLGLGFDQLSMNSANIARIKYVIRQTKLEDLKRLADKALGLSYASDVYDLALHYLEKHDLAGFTRPGKH